MVGHHHPSNQFVKMSLTVPMISVSAMSSAILGFCNQRKPSALR